MNAIKGQSEFGALPAAAETTSPVTGDGSDIMEVDFDPQSGDSQNGAISNIQLVEALVRSALFQKYQRAFQELTGLPLTLRTAEGWQLAHSGNSNQNSFCALMSQSSQPCAACMAMQQELCEKVNGAPCTLVCAFGLNETALAVTIGQQVIAYLLTGQVFFKPPGPWQTNDALHRIRARGFNLNLSEAARSYNGIPVVAWNEYQAAVRLLECFAEQLGSLADQVVLQQKGARPPQITRAQQFIETNYQQRLSLPAVAGHAGMNPFYFCKLFQKVTGMKFTRYVCCVRVEKAKNLLLNPHYHNCEIAFEVGFQSITHFNRIFRRIAGLSPTEFRHCLAGN